MPAHAPQAEQARRISAIACAAGGAPVRGFSVLSVPTARRKWTRQRLMSSGVFSTANIEAKASLAAAASALSVGKGSTTAASDMGPKFRVSCATFGRTSDADSSLNRAQTALVSIPIRPTDTCFGYQAGALDGCQDICDTARLSSKASTKRTAALSASVRSSRFFSAFTRLHSDHENIALCSGDIDAKAASSIQIFTISARVGSSCFIGAQYGADVMKGESAKAEQGTAFNRDHARIAVNVPGSGHFSSNNTKTPGDQYPTPGRMLPSLPGGVPGEARTPPTVRVSPSLSTAKGAGAFTLQRPSSSCVETRHKQPVGLVSVGLRQVGQILPVFSSNRKRSEFAPTRQNNPTQHLCKHGVGGFHRWSSVISPSLEAC